MAYSIHCYNSRIHLGFEMAKQATKGQKEIYKDNQSTIIYFGLASLVSVILYFMGCSLFWECSSKCYTYFGVTILIEVMALIFMKIMSGARFDDRGRVVDAGMDLNDPTAFGEYCKDAIILSIITQVFALYSSYGYLLLLLLPGFASYKIIFNFLLPWIKSSSESENIVDEKKMRKKERREKIIYRR